MGLFNKKPTPPEYPIEDLDGFDILVQDTEF